MDHFTDCFCRTVDIAAQTPGNGISIKLSPLVDYNTLKKANAAQVAFLEFFDEAVNHDPNANEASLEAVTIYLMTVIDVHMVFRFLTL